MGEVSRLEKLQNVLIAGIGSRKEISCDLVSSFDMT